MPCSTCPSSMPASRPDIAEFLIGHLLGRIETTFAAAAREKGLSLPRRAEPRLGAHRHHPARADPAQPCVERRSGYTPARWRRRRLPPSRRQRAHRGVDSGIGVAPDQQRSIFGEFYRVGAPVPDQGVGRRVGLGLGLSIVDGLGRLLGHPIDLASRPGKGRASPSRCRGRRPVRVDPVPTLDAIADPRAGQAHRRGSMTMRWSSTACAVCCGLGMPRRHRRTPTTGLAVCRPAGQPNLVISDYLPGERNDRRRRHPDGCGLASPPAISAFLISGDTTSERMREAERERPAAAAKPVTPMALRSMVNSALRAELASPAPMRPGTGLGAVRDLQHLQDGGDVVLHRRLGEIEAAADRLVALALHHQRQHVGLPPGQARGRRVEAGTAAAAWPGTAGPGTENLGRDRRRRRQNTRFSALVITSRPADFGMKPSAPWSSACTTIGALGKARAGRQRRCRGNAPAAPPAARAASRSGRLRSSRIRAMSGCSASTCIARAASGALEHRGLGPEFAEEAAQRLADQHMIVDDKDLHRKDRSQVASEARSGSTAYGPWTTHRDRCVAKQRRPTGDVLPGAYRSQGSYPHNRLSTVPTAACGSSSCRSGLARIASNEVVALQNALNLRLKPVKPLVLDGIFGPITGGAVRDFQEGARA